MGGDGRYSDANCCTLEFSVLSQEIAYAIVVFNLSGFCQIFINNNLTSFRITIFQHVKNI